MTGDGVRVFFYGSFMNRSVLAEAGVVPEDVEVARLWGYDLRIQPLGTLVPADGCCVYGVVCWMTHENLAELYSQDWVAAYRPHPVVVEGSGGLLPALCYIAPPGEPAPADPAYIDRIVAPARDHGFPAWYLERIERFRRGPLDA
jgi:hypothetical protein